MFDHFDCLDDSGLVTKWNTCYWHNILYNLCVYFSLCILLPLLHFEVFVTIQLAILLETKGRMVAPDVFKELIDSNLESFNIMHLFPFVL